jgi:hypothetical protein
MEKLSPTQEEALQIIREHGGRIIRLKGGFWTYPGCPAGNGIFRKYPSWSVDIKTVRCLEREGFLERANVFPEEWRDTRILKETAGGIRSDARKRQEEIDKEASSK